MRRIGEWRRWLAKNSARCEEIWLVFYKKATGKPAYHFEVFKFVKGSKEIGITPIAIDDNYIKEATLIESALHEMIIACTYSKKSKGNGILRRQVWCANEGNVTRYSLAYINHYLFSGDNGRVLGYDNAHGFHHKHYMGAIEPIHFLSFTEIEERFQQDFEVIHEKVRKK